MRKSVAAVLLEHQPLPELSPARGMVQCTCGGEVRVEDVWDQESVTAAMCAHQADMLAKARLSRLPRKQEREAEETVKRVKALVDTPGGWLPPGSRIVRVTNRRDGYEVIESMVRVSDVVKALDEAKARKELGRK